MILPIRFCPSADYYAAIAQSTEPVVINTATRFDKRCKAAHRCVIADTRGPLELTVPVAKPYGATWSQCRVSLHGRWWETMRVALESAYGRTPYFEFLADEFLSLIASPESFTTIADLCLAFDGAIRHALGLTTPVVYADAPTCDPIPQFHIPPYYQVRSAQLGFIPSLSILDLIFNLGPEALLLLRAAALIEN